MRSVGLEQDFAAKHPASFASVVNTLSIEDSLSVVTSLRPENVIDVLNYLSAPHVLAVAPQVITPVVLESTAFEKSLPVLLRLPRELMNDLTRGISDSHMRAKYRQALRLSTGTVATLVRPAFIVCDAETPIADLRELIAQSPDEPSVLVTGRQGLYQGVLAIWQCIASEDKPVAHATRYIAPLQVDSQLSNVRRHPLWNSRTWFPVVDHERHTIGVLWRHHAEGAQQSDALSDKRSTRFISSVVTALNDVTGTVAKEVSR